MLGHFCGPQSPDLMCSSQFFLYDPAEEDHWLALVFTWLAYTLMGINLRMENAAFVSASSSSEQSLVVYSVLKSNTSVQIDWFSFFNNLETKFLWFLLLDQHWREPKAAVSLETVSIFAYLLFEMYPLMWNVWVWIHLQILMVNE